MVSGRPEGRKLAHAFRQEYSYQGLKLAQLPGRLGVVLTWRAVRPAPPPALESQPKSCLSSRSGSAVRPTWRARATPALRRTRAVLYGEPLDKAQAWEYGLAAGPRIRCVWTYLVPKKWTISDFQ